MKESYLACILNGITYLSSIVSVSLMHRAMLAGLNSTRWMTIGVVSLLFIWELFIREESPDDPHYALRAAEAVLLVGAVVLMSTSIFLSRTVWLLGGGILELCLVLLILAAFVDMRRCWQA